MTGKTFDHRRSAVGEKVRVSFFDAEDKFAAPPIVGGKPPSSLGQKPEDHTEFPKMKSGGRHLLSSRIDSLAKPLARLAKPLHSLSAVFPESDHRIPWSRNRPKVVNEKNQVVNPPPLPPRSRTSAGVSRAALKYEASDHIKRLAKHRSVPKVADEKKCFSVKPLSLVYKPSLRILELSKPRIRQEKT